MKTTTKTLTKILVASAFAISSVAMAGGGYGKKSMKSKKTIAQVAIENGSFTTLVAALKCTDLVGAVSDQSAKLTVFAPTDDAFKKAGLTKENVCQKFPKEDLKNILLYHVAGEKLKSPAVVSGMNKKIKMLNGGFLMPKGNGSLVIAANKSKASVAIADVKASNGIIHAVDGVLLP